MALLAASTIEVRPGSGADTNGGCCTNAATTNYALQNAAQVAVTDLVATGNTTLDSATANFPADCAGNTVYLAGGSGSLVAIWRRIVTRNSATQIVVDANVAAGTGITCNMGGALATLGGCGALLVAAGGLAGMVTQIKGGTDILSSSSANVSGGVFTTSVTGFLISGYSSTRGDLNGSINSASRPVIDCGAITSITVIAAAAVATRLHVANVKVDGKGNASVIGFGMGIYTNCTATNCTTGFSGTTIIDTFCSAIACGTGFSGAGSATYVSCFTNDCTTVGFSGAGVSALINCISINDAIACNISGLGLTLVNFTIHEATGDGVTGATQNFRSINSVYTLNGGDAIDLSDTTTSPTTAYILNSAFYSNGTVYETSPPTANISGSITLTGDPYTNEATDDLSPNNTAGAGAALRGVGIDVYGQADNRDVGAVQHADPADGATGGFVIGS